MSWFGEPRRHSEARLKATNPLYYCRKSNFNEKQARKFLKVMREFKAKKLTSHGKIVKNRKQALAIAFAKAREVI